MKELMVHKNAEKEEKHFIVFSKVCFFQGV